MKQDLRLKILWSVTIVAWVAGILLAMQAARSIADIRPRLNQKVNDLDKIARLENRLTRLAAAQETFQKLPLRKPAPLKSVITAALPGVTVDEPAESHRDFMPGWTIYSNEISFTEIPVSQAFTLISKAESQTPPWRLSKCIIKSSFREAGLGYVTLTFDAVEKKD